MLTPKQIKDLRLMHGFSQADFCAITKIGEATLSRWERGLKIQNVANDHYLFLLGYDENLQRLRSRNNSPAYPAISEADLQKKFSSLDLNDNLIECSKTFELQPQIEGRE